MSGALVAVCALFGLCIGSFLNVVVWRVPRGESIVSPPSACPGCGHAIRPRDNLPVVSWLLLRGRCRDCREPISVRYPLAEAGTGLLFGLIAWQIGPSWELPALLYLGAIGVALALIDLDTHRLPDSIVLPSYGVAVVLLGLASGVGGEWGALVRALLGGLAMGAAYFVMVLAYPAGMGLGDVKLAGVLGIYLGWFGWGSLLVGFFAAFVVGGVFALVLVALKRAGRKSGIPFGPWMLVGTAIGIAVGQPLIEAYLDALA